MSAILGGKTLVLCMLDKEMEMAERGGGVNRGGVQERRTKRGGYEGGAGGDNGQRKKGICGASWSVYLFC